MPGKDDVPRARNTKKKFDKETLDLFGGKEQDWDKESGQMSNFHTDKFGAMRKKFPVEIGYEDEEFEDGADTA